MRTARGSRSVIARRPRRYVVDARAFNDAVAFRIVVEGTGRRVPDAATGFQLPAGSILWSHGLRDHYEALYERRRIEDVREGEWAAPPITVKLPDSARLRGDHRSGPAQLCRHGAPGGWPRAASREARPRPPARLPLHAAIRRGQREASRRSCAGRRQNHYALARRDRRPRPQHARQQRCRSPTSARRRIPQLFPMELRTAWLKPGRAVWRYLDGGESTPEGIKEFSRLAGELGFEYQVVEGQWAKWTAEQLRDVVEYSKEQGVGILVWRHRRTLEDPAERRALFASLQQAGVVGVKVDFLDHEAKEVIDLYQAILADAAESKLLINFHGSNKPAGEARTWPNEMSREGIYGMEHKSIKEWADVQYDVSLRADGGRTRRLHAGRLRRARGARRAGHIRSRARPSSPPRCSCTAGIRHRCWQIRPPT